MGAYVTEKIVEPRLGEYKGDYQPDDEPITDDEKRGMRNALISLLVFLAIMAFLLIPENAPLRSLNPDTGQMTLDKFLGNGLLFMILLLFAIPGYFYGKTTGKIKRSHD